MNRGAPSLVVTVVPDSGTEELVGLEGEFRDQHRGRQALLRVHLSLAWAAELMTSNLSLQPPSAAAELHR